MTKGFWKHINGVDMIIEVLASYDVHLDYIKIKYKCLTLCYNGDAHYSTDKIFKSTVVKSDLKNWINYERPKIC